MIPQTQLGDMIRHGRRKSFQRSPFAVQVDQEHFDALLGCFHFLTRYLSLGCLCCLTRFHLLGCLRCLTTTPMLHAAHLFVNTLNRLQKGVDSLSGPRYGPHIN